MTEGTSRRVADEAEGRSWRDGGGEAVVCSR
jgi:hypothetical protein